MTIKEKIFAVSQAIGNERLSNKEKASRLLELIDDCKQAVEDSNILHKKEAEKLFSDAWDIIASAKALGLFNQHQAMQVVLIAQILFDK